MEIYYSPKFGREYKNLSSKIKEAAKIKELIFRADPFDVRLKTHSLTGHLQGYWAFSVDRKTRIIFEFAKKTIVWFYSIGSHDIYKK